MLVTALLLVAWRDACAIILAQRSAPTATAPPPDARPRRPRSVRKSPDLPGPRRVARAGGGIR
eukprot:13564387-Heterocapsa_arctica.AAC.1